MSVPKSGKQAKTTHTHVRAQKRKQTCHKQSVEQYKIIYIVQKNKNNCTRNEPENKYYTGQQSYQNRPQHTKKNQSFIVQLMHIHSLLKQLKL